MCKSIESGLEVHVREVLLNVPLPSQSLLNYRTCHAINLLAFLERNLDDRGGKPRRAADPRRAQNG